MQIRRGHTIPDSKNQFQTERWTFQLNPKTSQISHVDGSHGRVSEEKLGSEQPTGCAIGDLCTAAVLEGLTAVLRVVESSCGHLLRELLLVEVCGRAVTAKHLIKCDPRIGLYKMCTAWPFCLASCCCGSRICLCFWTSREKSW